MQAQPRPQIKLKARLLPALVILMLALQLLFPYKGWTTLLAGLGGAWLLSYLWARSLARGLSLRRQLRGSWAQVGDRLDQRFTLANSGWAPALWAEVRDHSTLPGTGSSWGTGVGARAENSWQSSLRCERRGVSLVGPTTLRSGDPFGLYSVTWEYTATLRLTVLPAIVPLPQLEVAIGGRSGDGPSRPFALESTISVSGVRAYQPGDRLGWVHWPSSARRDQLFVRMFEGAPAGDWWIFLDLDRLAQAGHGLDSTEELGVVLAASLADMGLRAGRAVGLAAQSGELIWLAPQPGVGQRQRILQALAMATTGPQPLPELLALARRVDRRQISLIVITPSLDMRWVEQLAALARQGAAPTVLLLDPAEFGAERSSSALMPMLSALGLRATSLGRDLLAHQRQRAGEPEWRTLGSGKALRLRGEPQIPWKELV